MVGDAPLAAWVGLVAGGVLAVFQWRILKQFSSRAIWWLPANALACMLGMPIIFLAIDRIFLLEGFLEKALVFLLALALTGAIVGSVHGLFLLRIHAQNGNGDEKKDLENGI
jgi:hypothetical protein